MSSKTFFFYDLETSGLSPRADRIMQFAGIRTDMDLQQIGEPYNILVKLNDDTLPSPDALLVTGITPQMTQADGLTEAEFATLLQKDIFTADTITVGFNNVRFDDEFIRHLFWRTFRDPYEWAWQDGRSRWDMLDVIRMTRALRPEGIEWPFTSEGKETNRLELLTRLNGIEHTDAHDALADVRALIDVTKLIANHQPQLFSYLLKLRDKKQVQTLVNLDEKKPFVYVSGRYEDEFHKATIAFPLTSAPNKNVLVYNLRHDPTPFLELSEDDITSRLFAPYEKRQAEDFVRIPVKQLQYNRCPAVAPLGVLEEGNGWERIGLTAAVVTKHQQLLLGRPDFAERLRTAFERRPDFAPNADAEAQLYDGFIGDSDRLRVESIAKASVDELADMHPSFQDERLAPLLLHYKARNYPKALSDDEASLWEAWRAQHLQGQLPDFIASLQRISSSETMSDTQEFLVRELQLWAESIVPIQED